MDIISAEERSRRMACVKSKNTLPEIRVRKLLHSLGYRYRLHVQSLPGTPDIVFTKRKKVVLVHGCFWHQHHECRDSSMPKSNVEFWQNKLKGNIARDFDNIKKLADAGWTVLVIWECELKDHEGLSIRLKHFLK